MRSLLNSRPFAKFVLTTSLGVFHFDTKAAAKGYMRQLRKAGLSSALVRVQQRSVHTDHRFKYEPPKRPLNQS